MLFRRVSKIRCYQQRQPHDIVEDPTPTVVLTLESQQQTVLTRSIASWWLCAFITQECCTETMELRMGSTPNNAVKAPSRGK